MTKYLDLQGLTTYDLAIKLYIDNSTPESITTAEIEELFSGAVNLWPVENGIATVIGTYGGLTNPVFNFTRDEGSDVISVELANASESKSWSYDGQGSFVQVDVPSNENAPWNAIQPLVLNEYMLPDGVTFEASGGAGVNMPSVYEVITL